MQVGEKGHVRVEGRKEGSIQQGKGDVWQGKGIGDGIGGRRCFRRMEKGKERLITNLERQ